MHYILLLPCFALYAASFQVTNGLRLNVESVTEGNRDAEEIGHESGHQDSYKAIARQRRSVWTSLIDHIASLVKPLNMEVEPLLAEGVNNEGNFGKKLKANVRGNSKSSNVMLSEAMAERDIDAEEADKKMEWTIQKVLPPKEGQTWSRIRNLDFEVKDLEMTLIDELLEAHLPKAYVKRDDILTVLYKGITGRETVPILNRMYKLCSPEWKAKLASDLTLIRKLRESLQDLETTFTDRTLPDLKIQNQEIKVYLFKKLVPIRKSNDEWLDNKYVPEVIKEFTPFINMV